MVAKKQIDIATAAKMLGAAETTVYGRVSRGELSVVGYDAGGRMLLDAAAVRAAPPPRRGHPRKPASEFHGATYAAEVAKGATLAQVAKTHRVSRQAVSKDIARYNAARQREARAKARG